MAMTYAELQAMFREDLLKADGLQSLTYTDVSTAGSTAQTVDNALVTFPVAKTFGEPAVKGYQIDSVSLTFPDDEITVTPTIGDYVSVESVTYEVTMAEKVTAYTRWRLKAERAYVDDAWDLSCDIQRATLTVNTAGAQVETWADVTTGVAVIVVNNDDVADQISRLGIRGDKQSLNFYMAQSVTVLPMDRIEYSSRYYRVASIQDEGRVARLKRVVVELLA